MSAMTRKVADMAGDNHGIEKTQDAQAQEDLGRQQAAQEQPQVSSTDWEKVVAELKAQGESDRIDFKLQLAGVRNVKAARAILADHGGDVDALKEAEPWLFADTTAKQQGGRTGLPNAGTSTDTGKTMRRWRKLAGLDDSNDNA